MFIVSTVFSAECAGERMLKIGQKLMQFAEFGE